MTSDLNYESFSYVINAILIPLFVVLIAKLKSYITPERFSQILNQLSQSNKDAATLLKTAEKLIAIFACLETSLADGKLTQKELKDLTTQGKELVNSEEYRRLRGTYSYLINDKD
jgi:maleate cis-trans isomerase